MPAEPDGFRTTPVRVPLPASAVQLSAHGLSHACAVTEERELWCWGNNERGELGFAGSRHEGPTDRIVPMSSTPLRAAIDDVIEVSTGMRLTCARTGDGEIHCCGGVARFGMVEPLPGRGVLQPVRLPALSGLRSMSLGLWHACALDRDDNVVCWGINQERQLPFDENMVAPTVIDAHGDAVSVAVGLHHTCTLTESGSLRCFGLPESGALGHGSTRLRDDVFVQPLAPR